MQKDVEREQQAEGIPAAEVSGVADLGTNMFQTLNTQGLKAFGGGQASSGFGGFNLGGSGNFNVKSESATIQPTEVVAARKSEDDKVILSVFEKDSDSKIKQNAPLTQGLF